METWRALVLSALPGDEDSSSTRDSGPAGTLPEVLKKELRPSGEDCQSDGRSSGYGCGMLYEA